MKEQIKLSILIINYNGAQFLEDCISSVNDYCNSFTYEIIVVDNNSVDDSLKILSAMSGIHIIESKINLGFAKANNLAAKSAKGTFLLLLNNDTILCGNLAPLLNKFDEKVGSIGIKMIDKDKNYLPSVGKFPTPLKLIKLSLLADKRPGFKNGDFVEEEIVVNWVTGAFLMTPKKLYLEVNGLDESYFMYVEDVDYAKKICDRGMKTIFITNHSFIHFVGFNKKREKLLLKGYMLYVSKHFNTFERVIAKSCIQLNYAFKRIFKNLH